MAATRAERARLLLLQTGDTPDGLVAGVLDSLYSAESALDSDPDAQDAAVQVRVYDILLSYYTDWMSRVLTDDERATLQMRLNRYTAQRAAALTAQTTARQVSGSAVYTFNQDWLEPAGGTL